MKKIRYVNKNQSQSQNQNQKKKNIQIKVEKFQKKKIQSLIMENIII